MEYLSMSEDVEGNCPKDELPCNQKRREVVKQASQAGEDQNMTQFAKPASWSVRLSSCPDLETP